MKIRTIIRNPYRNGWSGPEFPVGNGPLVRIPRSTFFNLYGSYPVNDLLYVSTSTGMFFSQLKSTSIGESKSFEKLYEFLDSYHHYNCNPMCGKNINFWFDVGDIPTSKYQAFENEYKFTKKLSYMRLIKKYLSLDRH